MSKDQNRAEARRWLAQAQAYTREQAERAVAGALELVNAALPRETG